MCVCVRGKSRDMDVLDNPEMGGRTVAGNP